MVEPVVTALGHAGLCVEAQGVRLLLDPWVSRSGAFLGSWFPFPDNEHLPGPWLAGADLVVVSHEHLDHLDLDFLARLPAQVPIVVPRYPSTIIERRLAAAGRRHVIVLDAWERLRFGRDGWLTVIPEQCPMSHDAAVLVSVDGYSVLHTNDARISLAQTRRAMTEVGGPTVVDGGADVRGELAPGLLRLPADALAEVSERKRVGQVPRRHPAGAFGEAHPGAAVRRPAVLPRPGPVRAQRPAARARHLPRPARGAGLAARAAAAPAERLPPARRRGPAGGRWHPARPVLVRRSISTTPSRNAAGTSRRTPSGGAPRSTRCGRPTPTGGRLRAGRGVPGAPGVAGHAVVVLPGPDRAARALRACSVPAGGTWDAHLGPDAVRVDLDGGQGPADYEITVDARWLAGVVSGRTRWEELLLSLRISARREPDHLQRLPRRPAQARRPGGAACGRGVRGGPRPRGHDPWSSTTAAMLEVGRYCPHAGEDLAETGVVVRRACCAASGTTSSSTWPRGSASTRAATRCRSGRGRSAAYSCEVGQSRPRTAR